MKGSHAASSNPFKANILNGQRQIGLWCSINDSNIAEMLAGCGFDWLLFDTEHTPMSPLEVLPLLQAVAPYPVHPIVRPGSLDPAEIKRFLDCGVQSLLILMSRMLRKPDWQQLL